MKTREEAMQTLIEGSFGLQLNMNDTFAWGCSDVEEVDSSDAMDLIPYIQRYGYYALDAFVSAKRELLNQGIMHPMYMQEKYEKYYGESVREKKEKYSQSRREIIAAIKKGEEFSSLNYDYQKIKEDEAEFGEEVRWKGVKLEGQTYYTQIAFLAKKGLSGTGTNMKQALENLRLAVKRAKESVESK